MSKDLEQAAIDILRENDRGHYTVPTMGLYPFQWNWDSCFTALGQSHFDLDRAWLAGSPNITTRQRARRWAVAVSAGQQPWCWNF